MEWINVNEKLPEEGELVWACNHITGFVALACLVYEEGWLWAISNGIIYAEAETITSECDLDDDYDFTYWCALPKLPLMQENKVKIINLD